MVSIFRKQIACYISEIIGLHILFREIEIKNGYILFFFYLCGSDANSIVVIRSFTKLRNRQFQNARVNELGRLYLDVTCRFILHWAFGDALSLWAGSVTSF